MKKYIKFAVILFFVALFVGTIVFMWKTTRPEVTTYETFTIEKDSITTSTIATGSIQPRDEVLVKPQISGIIEKVYCEAGDMVKAGDVLALVKVIPEMGALNSAESRVKSAEISLDQRKRNYDRVKGLYDKGVATLEEYENATDDHKMAIEEMQNARNNLEIVEKGTVSNKSLGNTQIRATINGMVLDVPIKEGNSVIQANTFNDGTTIATIADLSDMLFIGNIDETEIGKINNGVKTKITVGAMQNITLDGNIEYISPKSAIDNGVTVFQIKAAVTLPDSVFIRAGYSANAEIITAEALNVDAMPERFVMFEGDKAYVEVLTSAEGEEGVQTFERKDVELGLSDGITVEIKSGLTETDKIKGQTKSPIK